METIRKQSCSRDQTYLLLAHMKDLIQCSKLIWENSSISVKTQMSYCWSLKGLFHSILSPYSENPSDHIVSEFFVGTVLGNGRWCVHWKCPILSTMIQLMSNIQIASAGISPLWVGEFGEEVPAIYSWGSYSNLMVISSVSECLIGHSGET